MRINNLQSIGKSKAATALDQRPPIRSSLSAAPTTAAFLIFEGVLVAENCMKPRQQPKQCVSLDTTLGIRHGLIRLIEVQAIKKRTWSSEDARACDRRL